MSLTRRLILAAALIAGVAPALAQVPPPVPALPDTERRTTYSITASLCSCNVNFALFGDSTDVANWLEVFVNGVKITQSGNWTITSPTGSIATIPRPIIDAVLTFTTAQTGTVQIVGARRPRRASQFTTQPSARDFNQVLTDIIAQNRESWDKTNDVSGRVPQAPPGETMALLPVLASRASMGACFDSSGNLTSCLSVPSSSFVAGNGISLTGVGPTTIAANITAASAAIVVVPGSPTTIALGNYTQTGTGAVSLSIASKVQRTVYPEEFGAACNGTGDDGPAIQRAMNATGDVRLSPDCVYRVVTPLTRTTNKLRIRGAGRYVSVIDFEPGANAALFTIGNSGGAETHAIDFSGFSMISGDTTRVKQCLTIIDISESRFTNLSCTQTVFAGGNWQGGAQSSCINGFGRDLTVFEDWECFADIPIILNPNPNFASLNTDHWVFRDMYLASGPVGAQPCVLAQTGIVITNLTFEGRQAWARCAGGFTAVDTTSATSWNNLSFNNVRTEQNTGGVGAFAFNISPNTALRNLTINNSQIDANSKGIALRKVLGATISNNQASCTVPTFIDIDTTTDQINLVNNRLEATCTASLGGMIGMNVIANPTGSAVPAFATYLNAATRASILTAPQAGASLPTCNAAATGARATINNSNNTLTAGIGGIVGFPGANIVPVFCDGTNWRIGANDNIPFYLRRKIG